MMNQQLHFWNMLGYWKIVAATPKVKGKRNLLENNLYQNIKLGDVLTIKIWTFW
jgi:hypothetical protein